MISKKLSQKGFFKSRNRKKAAMEMSVGTIVTVVLAMTMLILGLVMIRTIFRGSTENINNIDQSVKNEINKLFAEDDSRRIVVYPSTREISVKKGQEGGFGFSIRNVDLEDGSFSYEVSVAEIGTGCKMTEENAANLIVLGRTRNGIQISSGSSLETPELVKFRIPETAPLCSLRYSVDVTKDGDSYQTASVDVKITAA